MTRPLFVGPTHWPGVETLGPWSVGREGLDAEQATLRMGQPKGARTLASETQKSQKVGSQCHRRRARDKEMEANRARVGARGQRWLGDVGDLRHVAGWLARCSCRSRMPPLFDYTILEPMISSSGESEMSCLPVRSRKNSFDLVCFACACQRL